MTQDKDSILGDIKALVRFCRGPNYDLLITQEHFDFAFRMITHICGYHKVEPEQLGDMVEQLLENKGKRSP